MRLTLLLTSTESQSSKTIRVCVADASSEAVSALVHAKVWDASYNRRSSDSNRELAYAYDFVS